MAEPEAQGLTGLFGAYADGSDDEAASGGEGELLIPALGVLDPGVCQVPWSPCVLLRSRLPA